MHHQTFLSLHADSLMVLLSAIRYPIGLPSIVTIFCDVNRTPLLPLSLDRFPPNFSRTRVQMVARDAWFHIPERFPSRGRICRKTLFLGTLFVLSLRVTGNVLRRLHSFRPLVDIPQTYLSWVPFAD